jgi:hypothetical protein
MTTKIHDTYNVQLVRRYGMSVMKSVQLKSLRIKKGRSRLFQIVTEGIVSSWSYRSMKLRNVQNTCIRGGDG